MKTLSRRCRKVAPLILLGLLLDQTPVNQSAQALVGGPFDDNNFPGVNADGTYSATVSGKNLIGMVIFGVSASSEQNGRFSIFHEGFVHYGVAAGQADLGSRRLFGSFLGVAALGGNGNGGGIVESTGGSANVQNAGGITQTLTVRSSVEGAWRAQIKGYPQSVVFEGEGRLSSASNNAVMNGSAGGPVTFTTTISLPASAGTTFDEPASETDIPLDGQVQLAQVRSETPFKIRGSRTSRTLFTALNNYASIPPIVPTNPTTPTPTPTPVVPGLPIVAP
ncbi:MAG TPA: hypothetical protein VGO90_01255 [Chthoniobacteraceae bacterium]|jgi:hypothetical protein|nr:hypothetical protein [Chthoniobacteraceae bacterium]